MKIYLASKFALSERVELIAGYLKERGHEITVEWWRTDFKKAFGLIADSDWYNKDVIREIHNKNFKGIDDADIVVLVCSNTDAVKFNGANVEIGYAIAKGKRVMSCGNLERSAMYLSIERHLVINQLLEAIGD